LIPSGYIENLLRDHLAALRPDARLSIGYISYSYLVSYKSLALLSDCSLWFFQGVILEFI